MRQVSLLTAMKRVTKATERLELRKQVLARRRAELEALIAWMQQPKARDRGESR